LKITGLSALNFRNLAALEIRPGDRFNVISGENGEGKSNLLELIDYIGRLSSFRGAKTADIIRYERKVSEICSTVSGKFGKREHRITIDRERSRRVAIDGKRPRTKGEYFRAIQTVVFYPGSIRISSGAADKRRAFVDRILEQLDPIYGATLTDYNRALRSRNRLLREERPDIEAITTYNELMASTGAVIGKVRKELVDRIGPLAEEAFREINLEKVTLTMRYEPRVQPNIEVIRDALDKSLKKDLARGFTAEGPHADEIGFEMNRSSVRTFASQGQHRAIVLALKIAELNEIEKRTGEVPILLLDDVSSELDRGANRRFFGIISEIGGQVFLTTTHREFIVLKRDRTDFEVKSGVVTRC
jgi:DNA replication and repair protein RecF